MAFVLLKYSLARAHHYINYPIKLFVQIKYTKLHDYMIGLTTKTEWYVGTPRCVLETLINKDINLGYSTRGPRPHL
jgi:hypothetical protein